MLVMFITLFPYKISAQEGIQFSVDAILPENQVDDQVTYFHLDASDGLKQTLQVNINNLSKEEITIQTKLSQAITNSNGQIQYGNEFEEHRYFQLEHKIEDYIKVNHPQVTIPAESQAQTEISINIEPQVIKGLVLGGLNFSMVEDDKKDSQGIGSVYEYNIALAINNNSELLKSSKTMDYKGSELNLHNYRKAISLKFVNEEAAILSDLKMNVIITDPQGEMIEQNAQDMELAPNTRFTYPVLLGKEDIKPGAYKIKIVADSYKQHWEWEDELIIENTEAKKINKQDVDRVRIPDFLINLCLVLIIISAFSLIINIKATKKEGHKNV